METIYFVGIEGCGKEMVAGLLAARKNLTFIDTKKLLLDDKSIKLPDIFENINQGNIVSVDDKLILDEDARHIIKKTGRVFYLNGSSNTILDNLKNTNINDSFLRNNLSILTIEKLINERKNYYEELENYMLNIDSKTIKEIFIEALAIYHMINKVKCHIYIK